MFGDIQVEKKMYLHKSPVFKIFSGEKKAINTLNIKVKPLHIVL